MSKNGVNSIQAKVLVHHFLLDSILWEQAPLWKYRLPQVSANLVEMIKQILQQQASLFKMKYQRKVRVKVNFNVLLDLINITIL